MLKCSESQQAFLDGTAQAAKKALLKAQEADKLGLKTLAREWSYFSMAFTTAIERQLRVFEIGEELNEETFFFADRNGGLEAFICIRQNEGWIRSLKAGRWKTAAEFLADFIHVNQDAQIEKELPFD